VDFERDPFENPEFAAGSVIENKGLGDVPQGNERVT
jgi:hypothetical protein